MSKLSNIQILRAVAALSVVIYHLGVESTHVCEGLGRDCSYDLEFGVMGVPLFFLVSGFIMVATSWNSFGSVSNAGDFILRRLERIVPLYWLVTTMAVVGVVLFPHILNVPVLDLPYILSSYLFWPVTRVNGLVRPIANLGWTLNLEMMFYIVFALSLPLRRSSGMVVSIFVLLCLCVAHVSGIFASEGPLRSVSLNFWGDPLILNFGIGMLAAAIYKTGRRLRTSAVVPLLAAFVLSAIIYRWYQPELSVLAEDGLPSRLLSAAPVFLLFVTAVFGPQVDVSKRIWAIMLLLGDASYSLYLIHPFVLRPLAKIWAAVIGSHLPPLAFAALGLPLAVMAGLGFYALFERPTVDWFHRRRTDRSAKINTITDSANAR